MFQVNSKYFNLLLISRSRKNRKIKAATNQIHKEREPLGTKERTEINVEVTTTRCREFPEGLELVTLMMKMMIAKLSIWIYHLGLQWTDYYFRTQSSI